MRTLLSVILLSATLLAPVFSFATTTGSTTCPVFMRTLARGSRGPDVVMLQSYLISESLLPPRSATGYFGTLTEKAVQAWQKKYGVVTGGTPETTGFGVVGKLTRIALAKCGASTATTFDPHSTTTGQLPPTGTGGWGTGGGPFKDDTAISASCILESGKIGDCALK